MLILIVLMQAASAGLSFAENIIVTALTTGFILALIKLIRDWTSDKSAAKSESKKKEEEAETIEISNEERKIALGDKFIESSKQIIDMLTKAQTSQTQDFGLVNQKLDTMAEDLIGIKREQTDMKEFLNGSYGEFLRQKYNLTK